MRNISFDCCDGTVVSILPVEDPYDWNIHLMLAFPLSGTERNAKVTPLLVRLRSRFIISQTIISILDLRKILV